MRLKVEVAVVFALFAVAVAGGCTPPATDMFAVKTGGGDASCVASQRCLSERLCSCMGMATDAATWTCRAVSGSSNLNAKENNCTAATACFSAFAKCMADAALVNVTAGAPSTAACLGGLRTGIESLNTTTAVFAGSPVEEACQYTACAFLAGIGSSCPVAAAMCQSPLYYNGSLVLSGLKIESHSRRKEWVEEDLQVAIEYDLGMVLGSRANVTSLVVLAERQAVRADFIVRVAPINARLVDGLATAAANTSWLAATALYLQQAGYATANMRVYGVTANEEAEVPPVPRPPPTECDDGCMAGILMGGALFMIIFVIVVFAVVRRPSLADAQFEDTEPCADEEE